MPESPKQTGWEDITFDDINEQVLAGNVPQALALAKTRLELIKNVSAEVDVNNNDGEVPLENWQDIKKDFAEEITQLSTFIAFHQKNPKYRQ